jgi:CRP/FNR family cyclic AMP-dependent transcriptional regulator
LGVDGVSVTQKTLARRVVGGVAPSAMPTHAELLHDVSFFALLDDDERATLATRLDVVNEPKGKILFNVGDAGGALFVVMKGEVELFFKNDTGERIVVETVRVGDFFGEISLLDGGPRTTSAIINEDLEALVIDRGDLDEFLRLRPAAALDLLTATGKRLRETTRLLRHSASKNPNIETEDNRTAALKIADAISDFSGSLPFLWIHIVVFAIWIALNVPPLVRTSIGGFDPFPFGLLTMAVSLEAIVLSVFVLLSQNRQAARDRVRNEIEYNVNLKAELEVAQLHEVVDDLRVELLARFDALERRP